MSEELITPENLSKELLKSIFDAAYIEASYDNDGNLYIEDKIKCWVFSSEAKDRVKLLTIFGFKPETKQQQRLTFINELNREYIVVKTIVGDNDTLRLEYDILIKGGSTKKNLVLTVKRFCGIPHDAIKAISEKLGSDIVE